MVTELLHLELLSASAADLGGIADSLFVQTLHLLFYLVELVKDYAV